jgi:hypothetical protein
MTTVSDLCAGDDVSGIKTWLENKENLLTETQAKTIGDFFNSQSENSVVLSLWGSLQRNVPNLILVHPYVQDRMIRAATWRHEAKAGTPSEALTK